MAGRPPITAAQVLDALRAALAYVQAVKRLGRTLDGNERKALLWTLHGKGEYAAAWTTASRAEQDEAAALIGELSTFLEPAGRSTQAVKRGQPAPAPPLRSTRPTPSARRRTDTARRS